MGVMMIWKKKKDPNKILSSKADHKALQKELVQGLLKKLKNSSDWKIISDRRYQHVAEDLVIDVYDNQIKILNPIPIIIKDWALRYKISKKLKTIEWYYKNTSLDFMIRYLKGNLQYKLIIKPDPNNDSVMYYNWRKDNCEGGSFNCTVACNGKMELCFWFELESDLVAFKLMFAI